MGHQNTYLLKIGFRKFGKHFNLLTKEEKSIVWDIYYDFY